MRNNLITYIIKYHFFLLFIVLEFLCILLIARNNAFHNSQLINFANYISGSLNTFTDNTSDYLHLKLINTQVVDENLQLKNELSRLKQYDRFVKEPVDSNILHYKYLQARVVNNSINKRYNFITLNKGLKDSVQLEMAVISNDGVIGVINRVTENYSTAISILNPKLKISAKINKNNYFGSLTWEGHDPEECVLSEIPHHVTIEKGDTIVTSGFSVIFPEGIIIGFIDDFEIKEGNFYNIKVKLSLDMQSLKNVYIVENNLQEEQVELESLND